MLHEFGFFVYRQQGLTKHPLEVEDVIRYRDGEIKRDLPVS